MITADVAKILATADNKAASNMTELSVLPFEPIAIKGKFKLEKLS